MDNPGAEGKRLAKQGDFEAALPFLEQAARENPTSPDVWLALGACYFRLDRNDDFREALRKALFLDPGHAPTRRFLRNTTGAEIIPAPDSGREKIRMEEGGIPEISIPEKMGRSIGCSGVFLLLIGGLAAVAILG